MFIAIQMVPVPIARPARTRHLQPFNQRLGLREAKFRADFFQCIIKKASLKIHHTAKCTLCLMGQSMPSPSRLQKQIQLEKGTKFHLAEDILCFGHHDHLCSLQRCSNKPLASQWLEEEGKRNLDRKEEPSLWETGKEDAVQHFRKH